MQKNNFFSGAIVLVVGIFIGFLVWGFGGNKGGEMAENDSLKNGVMDSDMRDEMDKMMSEIINKTGDEFDKAFLNEMIIHHEGAVEMSNLALATSKKSEILILASDIVAGQTREIAKMKEWLEKWFNTSSMNQVPVYVR